jgi:hypothetical protein
MLGMSSANAVIRRSATTGGFERPLSQRRMFLTDPEQTFDLG